MANLPTDVHYEYMDKTAIDQDLYCDYCSNPLVDPVSTPCKHTFCRSCIEKKLKSTGGVCAKVKCKNRSISINDLVPVTERIVLNMLDRLLVKCPKCGTTNIQRGSFDKHITKLCPKASVRCSAADLKCPWTGSVDQLKQHVLVCTYEQMRPVLLEVIQDNSRLKEQIQQASEQCSSKHSSCIKELQETNQNLRTNIEKLAETLDQEKTQLKDLRAEFQQLKDLIIQDKTSINSLHQEIQQDKKEITRVDERCTQQEIKINQINDRLDPKGGSIAYQNPQLETSLSKCQSRTTVDLSKQHLVDCDVETVVKQALIEKECTRLDLGYNSITSKGAALLANALKNNTTLEELDFHNNRLSDLGVHSLADVLASNSSILKALGLGSNGITDSGAERLAEMLKTNQTITWLALAGNQISDRGVELLANTLAHQNTSLLVLSLHVNKSISDASVDTIIDMLQHNKSLKKLWIQDCSISENGKLKLRDAAKLKQGFSLYM